MKFNVFAWTHESVQPLLNQVGITEITNPISTGERSSIIKGNSIPWEAIDCEISAEQVIALSDLRQVMLGKWKDGKRFLFLDDHMFKHR